ncbi:MAG: hypothetical protein PHE51_06720 [Eubacteriales bacterium]|nr:hypothetical protein [Eubacteriales bacterium]
MITVKRKTSESIITVKLDQTGLKENYREKIETTIPFLNHMIEHITWRSGFGIETDVKLDKFQLDHLICEDTGMALGKAFAKHAKETPCKGYGDAAGIIDEARAIAYISFENRAMFIMDRACEIPAQTEGMNSEDLGTFLEGFAHGAGCTIQIDFQRGENGHHIWEAIYRAFGMALGMACSEDASRKGRTAGVAGKIEYEVQ